MTQSNGFMPKRMNKKGIGSLIGFIMLGIMLLLLFIFIVVFDIKSPEDLAKEKCQKVDMELLSYDTGWFIKETITCYDPLTKQINKIS